MAEINLLPIRIPPGVVTRDSPNASLGRYTDCDKFRFDGQYPEKWGGWRSFVATTLIGSTFPFRGAVSWATLLGNQNMAFGSFAKLFVVTGGEAISDITPLRASGTLSTDDSVTVSTTAGNVVTIVDSSHGVTEGSYVTLETTVLVGGMLISGEYRVDSVVDADTYTILAASTTGPATSTNADGANWTYAYQINIGNLHPGFGTGWGMGEWGASTGGWGTELESGGLAVDLRHWSLDDYGNNLLACPFGDTLYDWEEGVDSRAQVIVNAPDYIRSMFVTPERFVFALGTDDGSGVDPMRIQWPDRDDITDWTPTASNTANSRTLQNGSKLVGGMGLQDLISLVWSDTALYVFQYTGDDFVYQDRLAGDNCGLIGPLAFCNVSGTAFWMSGHDFHMYAGGVQSIPNADDVSGYIFGRLNRQFTQKTWCVYNVLAGTIMWGYVSVDSVEFEPDEYVEVSLENFAWSFGTLERTCGAVFRPHEGSLVLGDHSGQLWEHETGTDAGDEAMEAFITYGEYQLSEGMENVDIMGLVPDFQRQSGQVEAYLYTKDRPEDQSTFDAQTIILDEGQHIGDARISGRVFGMTFRTNDIGGDLRCGIPSLEVAQAGRRR